MSNNIVLIKAAINDNLGDLRSVATQSQIDKAAEAISERGDKSVLAVLREVVGYIPSNYSANVDSIVAAIESLGATSEEAVAEVKPVDVSADEVKAAIVNVIGESNAIHAGSVVSRAAVAIANRGTSDLRATVVTAAGWYANSYPQFVNSIVTAVELLEGKTEAPVAEGKIKSIKHTIGAALPAIHIPTDYMLKVVDALTEREYQIAENIVKAANGYLNLSEESVKGYITEAGLSFRPEPVIEVVPEVILEDEPEAEDATAPEAEGDATFREDRREAVTEAVTVDSNDGVVGEVSGKSDSDRLRKLEKQVKKLTKLAKRHLSF